MKKQTKKQTAEASYTPKYNDYSKRWRIVKTQGETTTRLKGAYKTQEEAEAAAKAAAAPSLEQVAKEIGIRKRASKAPKGKKTKTAMDKQLKKQIADAAPKAKKAAKKTAAKKEAAAPKAESKGGKILALIARTGGATATELQEASGWQAHSVRGFLSTAAKKGLAKIASARKDGVTTYSIG